MSRGVMLLDSNLRLKQRSFCACAMWFLHCCTLRCRLVVSATKMCFCSCWVHELVDWESIWLRLTQSWSMTVTG